MNLYIADQGPPDIYRGFQRVLIEQQRVDKALEVSEQGRAKGFVDFLTSHIGARSPFLPSVSPLSIYQIKQIAKSQASTLVEYSLIYDYNQFYQGSSTRSPNWGIHDIYAYATELLIWVVSPKGQIWFQEVDLTPLLEEYQTSLANLVRTVREAIALGKDYLSKLPPLFRSYSLDEQLQLLYRFLISPIADWLPRDPSSRVMIIPQDFLFLLPFGALKDQNGQYLIEKHTLLSAPSLQAIELIRKRQKNSFVLLDLPPDQSLSSSLTPKNGDRLSDPTAKLPLTLYPALVLGNPTMPSFSPQFGEVPVYMTRLPGAEIEAKAVAEVLNAAPLTNDAATRTVVLEQMPKARIIHLATHGWLGSTECMEGVVALAPNSQGKNGFLTLRDIFHLSSDRHQLPLSADLVCLSACDIARGQIWGDGVFRLSQAFLLAGANTLIISLWLPPTDSSPILMKQFYQDFQDTGDKAQSLRQAMLSTREKFPEPRYWAGFTLFGSPAQ